MQFNLIFPLVYPLPHLFGVMNPQVIHDEEYLVLRVVEQALQKIDEALGIDGTIMQTKPHQTLIGHGRYQRDAVPTRRVQQLRRLPARRVASNPSRVLADGRLVGPVDRATLRLGSPNDLRIGLVRPRLQCGLVLLPSAPGRPLRRHAPAHQVFTNGTDRHVGIKIGTDEFLNRTPSPQRIRQAMGRRPILNDLVSQQRFVVTGQGAVCTLHASSPKGNHILFTELVTAQAVTPRPDHHGTKTHPHDRSNFCPSSSIQPQAVCLGTEQLQAFFAEAAGVRLLHQ